MALTNDEVLAGLAELITMFCRQICRFVDIRWVHRQLEDPPLIHGFIRTLLLPFAMLENHPGLARTHREETLEALLTLYRSTEGAGNTRFLSQVDLNRVRQNHQTRTALDLYYGGRHFHQVHGLEEGVSWMQLAERFFEPQMASNKPVCDSWGHQWAASLFDTADFALAAGRMDYFASRPFLEGVDRALVAHSSLEEAPLQYFLMAAAHAFKRKDSSVSFTSCFFASSERDLRNFSSSVISASSWCVTIGTLSHARCRLTPVFFLIRERG